MTVEKNDVNISQLFKWGREFKIQDEEGFELSTVYIRLAGDADLNRAKVIALRESAELRRQLKQENSDVRLAFILDKDLLDREKLLAINLTLSSREIAQKAYREVKVPYPTEPKSDAKLEAFEKYQAEVDKYPEKRSKAVQKFVEKELKLLTESLERKTDDELYKVYETTAINELCEERMIKSFREVCTYYGCYKDSSFKEHLFESLEDFLNLDTSIKEQFIDAYQSLEIPTEELKKLRVVMQ